MAVKNLAGQKVIITGASSGIGEALALECAKRGMVVAVVARRLDRLERLVQRIQETGAQAYCAQLDITDFAQVPVVFSQLADQMGGLDMVIANAGVSYAHRIGDGGFEFDHAIFQTNTLAAIATADAAVQLLRKLNANQTQKGCLVAVSSFSAFLPLPFAASYSASKAAMTNYFNGIRAYLSKEGIKVTVAHPGFVKTDMTEGFKPRGIPIMARADVVAEQIMTAVAKGETNPMIPKMPWGIMHRVQQWLPDSLVFELQKRM